MVIKWVVSGSCACCCIFWPRPLMISTSKKEVWHHRASAIRRPPSKQTLNPINKTIFSGFYYFVRFLIFIISRGHPICVSQKYIWKKLSFSHRIIKIIGICICVGRLNELPCVSRKNSKEARIKCLCDCSKINILGKRVRSSRKLCRQKIK